MSGFVPDERSLIEFKVPHVLAQVFPDRRDAPPGLRKRSVWGSRSQALPATS